MSLCLLKREFHKWIKTLDSTSLSELDRKFLNLLILNFDSLVPLSTAGGTRAKKITQLIEQQLTSISSELQEVIDLGKDDLVIFNNIKELIVGPFRGFSSEEIFNFDKRYTFMYGPNGSGKSSFCEGLEYALLGNIEEAEAKRIEINTYAKNHTTGKFREPVLKGNTTNGEISVISRNPEAYHFCFIEKNRIDSFARIAATTSKTQLDLIAILFGLDSFSNFVNGFTDDLGKYLTLANKKKDDFKDEQAQIIASKARLVDLSKEIKILEYEAKKLVQDFSEPNIHNILELKTFLIGKDGLSGIIGTLHLKRSENIPDDIDSNYFTRILEKQTTLKNNITQINALQAELIKYSTELNFKDLYSSINRIASDNNSNKSICPACKTPIQKVSINPFTNASSELSKMKHLQQIQTNIELAARTVASNLKDMNKEILNLNEALKRTGNSNINYPTYTEGQNITFHAIQEWIKILSFEIDKLNQSLCTKENILLIIKSYNKQLEDRRKNIAVIDSRIQKYNQLRTQVDRIDAVLNSKTIEKEKLIKDIDNFDKKNVQILKDIEALDKVVELHMEVKKSYEKLINNLRSYRNDLPARLAYGLSDKAKEYYNIINEHDPSFEKLESLSLPQGTGDKINIRFNDDGAFLDALQILSEGHIKVLGLSVLLSKVVYDNIGFIIYDDIVNAIDDGHRNGIAELILKHPDLKDRQHIITCHGENFISLLEHKLGASLASQQVKRYTFVPIDETNERGIRIDNADPKHTLILAKDSFKSSNLRDSAHNCRQTIENISENLWYKLAKTYRFEINVSMRSPKSKPDTSSVVDGLIKTLKNKVGFETIYKNLVEIKDKYNWSLLNTSSHSQSDLPEYERKDISELLVILEELEKEVDQLKLNIINA